MPSTGRLSPAVPRERFAARTPLESLPSMRRIRPFPPAVQALLAGGLVTGGVVVVLLSIYQGPDQVSFVNPDEAVTRHAAQVVFERGRPVEPPPFEDPAGLTHQRLWVRVEGGYTPAYPATQPLLLGWAARLPAGGWLVLLLPAVGLGSLVAAVALALPRHRWAALLLPGLAFPGAYWFLRPWTNISAMLAASGLAALLWVWWARSRRGLLGVAALAAAALAAALRPDQVHVALGLSLLAFLAVTRGRAARRWLVAHLLAGLAVAAAVAGGNLLTTGSWLTTPVDLLDLPVADQPAANRLPVPLRHLARIAGHHGAPAPAVVAFQLRKYWWGLGPMWLVSLLALALVAGLLAALWRGGDRRRLVLTAGAVLLLGSLFVTRVNLSDHGAALGRGALVHSLPRYGAATFLGAGVAVLAGAVAIRRAVVRAAVLGAVTAAALAGGAYVLDAPGAREEDVAFLAAHHRRMAGLPAAVRRDAPAHAVLYSFNLDRYLWSAAPVGLVQHEGAHMTEGPVALHDLVRTLPAAVEAGYTPVLFQVPAPLAAELDERLWWRDLDLEPIRLAGLPARQVVRRGP